MKQQLRGIALILAGIFLTLVALTGFLDSLNGILWIAAATVTAAGLVLAWRGGD